MGRLAGMLEKVRTEMRTEVKQHQWVEMKVTPVEVITDRYGNHIPVSTGKEPQITIGCFACNMGLDEGAEVGCPGQDLFEG